MSGNSASGKWFQPIADTERIEFIDVLRGFALLGVCLVNLVIFSGDGYITDAQRELLPFAAANMVVNFLIHFFAENKFLGLFAFLFGLGFSIQIQRAQARGSTGIGRFYRRIGWLFVFGAVHGWLLWWGDILRFYALWGMLLPLFIRLRPRTILMLALTISIVIAPLGGRIASMLYPAAREASNLDAQAFTAFSLGSYAEMLRLNWLYDWSTTASPGQVAYQLAIFGRLLLGLWAGQVMLFHDLSKNRPLFRKVFVWGILLGLAGNALFASLPLLQEHGYAVTGWWRTAVRSLYEIGYLGFTAAFACGLALLIQRERWTKLLRLLAPVGRMALTNYLTQTIIGLWLFYAFLSGPALMGKVGVAMLLPMWLIIFAVQVGFSHWWLRRFKFGPAEWVWRSLTYRRFQPFRIAR